MQIEIFKLFHYLGLMFLFYSFGGLMLGARIAGGRNFPLRRRYVLLHGAGLLLLFITGFAQLGILKISPMTPWAFTKIGLWALLGLMLTFVLNKPQLHRIWWVFILLLGISGAGLALYKPF